MMLTTADEIGNILREARELKGATLNDVHQNLRISVKFLKALESGEYHHLPSTTHVRGYLGKYARFLGLEPTPLLERYESIKDMLPQPGGNTAAYPPLPNYTQTQPHLPEPETGTFFEANPVEVGPMAANSGGDWIGRLIVLALIISIGLISWRFAPLVLGFFDGSATEAIISETAVQQVLEENAQVLTATMELDTFADLPTSRPTNPEGDTAAVATPVADPTRSPLPATLDRIDIELDVTERTWLSVTVDGAIAYEGQARKGDTFSWNASRSVTLRTGNGAGVFVKINGIDLGRLGERSSVVEQTWETTR
jgi:cytoskeleton protein RodZ